MEKSVSSRKVGLTTGSRTPMDGLVEYATRFHAAMGSGHSAASPLGAYMLLAAAATAAEGADRAELERSLGCPTDEAMRFVTALLEFPHPAVQLAIALWNHPAFVTPKLLDWMAQLPLGIERGPVPTQAAADAWVTKVTGGQLRQLPASIDERTVLLLASALATAGKWNRQFGLAPVSELGPSAWSGDVERVLAKTVRGGEAIAWTKSAGLVGIQVSGTDEAFYVVSVIAAPDVPPCAVVAAAHEVARHRPDLVQARSLYDLPLGEGHAWTIEELEMPSHTNDTREEFARILIPAWEVPSTPLDLLADPAYGFGTAAETLLAILRPTSEGYDAQAVQSTTAKFDRLGFSAASVTVLVIEERSIGPGPREIKGATARTATVRFSRPFAAVAVAEFPRELQQRFGLDAPVSNGPHPWEGVPLFSAWITRPIEPDRTGPTFNS